MATEDARNMGIILGDKVGILHRKSRRKSPRLTPEVEISSRRERQN
jgi:hypothetical protein